MQVSKSTHEMFELFYISTARLIFYPIHISIILYDFLSTNSLFVVQLIGSYFNQWPSYMTDLIRCIQMTSILDVFCYLLQEGKLYKLDGLVMFLYCKSIFNKFVSITNVIIMLDQPLS